MDFVGSKGDISSLAAYCIVAPYVGRFHECGASRRRCGTGAGIYGGPLLSTVA